MKKICLTVVGLYLMFLQAFSQESADSSGVYKNRKLKFEELNLISSYYSQDGNHSAVTGGIGTQQLTDFGNIIQLKFVRWDMHSRKHITDFELGIDHHTAASSAYVSKSGASSTGGTRVYPSIHFKTENEEKRNSIGWGLMYSGEFNYQSYGANLNYSKTSRNLNREFSAKVQVYLDQVKMIQPSEFNTEPTQTVTVVTSASGRTSRSYANTGASAGIPSSPRNTVNASFSITQVVNRNLQVSLLADGVAQSGYLGLPFHRVYWNDGSVHIENLPDSRLKLPLGARLNYFMGDKFILRSYYRFYTDTWGITSHTASVELPWKISSFISVSPFYRYYTQTAAKYFAPYGEHTAEEVYYTSNYDYSAFQSHYVGINFRVAPPKGVLGIRHFNLLEIRAGHYQQTTGLNANSISMNLRFK